MEEFTLKILVTGGAGFIGSNFVYLMLEKHKENGCGALIVSHRTNHFKKIIDIELTIKNKKILEKS